MPATRAVEEIWAGQDGEEAARGALLASLNAGPALVNYIGHGSVEVWRGNLLTSEDALGLTNGGRLPIVVAMTCLNGFFQDLYTYSLAEALLNAERGGAVAVWASSSLELPQGQAVMNRVLLGHLLQDKLTLGEAVRKAKAAVSDRDGRRTWILFGDPTIRLK